MDVAVLDVPVHRRVTRLQKTLVAVLFHFADFNLNSERTFTAKYAIFDWTSAFAISSS